MKPDWYIDKSDSDGATPEWSSRLTLLLRTTPGCGTTGAAVFPFLSLLFPIFPVHPPFYSQVPIRDFVLVLFPDTFSGGLPADFLLVVKDVPPWFFFF